MKPLIFIAILSGCCPHSRAGELFEGSQVLEIQLSGPLDSVIKDVTERQEKPFVMTVDGAVIPVGVKVRGNSRTRVCKFPPLRINFNGGNTQQTVFEGQEKLKLVTHCLNDNGRSMNVLKEYAAYRMFNLISEESYRVRLLRIRYQDTQRTSDHDENPEYGFVLEPKQQLLERTGGELAEIPGVKISQVEANQAALVFVFQYMIGNTDWSLATAHGEESCCHNVTLLTRDSALYPVPYDFDLSGLVSAFYAKPDSSLRTRNVRQRRYRGYCIDHEAVRRSVHKVKSKQAEILEVLENLPDYPTKKIINALEYLEQFFESAENEAKILKTFEKRCLD